jgi:V8-like Glu-specific endopeptidase
MPETPIPFPQLRRRVKARPRLTDKVEARLSQTLYLTGPKPQVRLTEAVPVKDGGSTDPKAQVFRVDLEAEVTRVGVHAFPPGIEGTKLARRRKLLREDDHVELVHGFLPDHLALRPLPERLDKRFRVAQRFDSLAKPEEQIATTVFAPDDRYTFSDTAFPWCTVGRVDTAGGTASGVMIGPRHMLTVSHTIQWLSPPSPYVAGWIKFTPSYFDGSAPFGVAWGTWIYWQFQVAGPGIDTTEEQFDYVVVVLDRRMGDLTGWMGSRTYSDSWDGGNYWSHIGYPADLASAERPSFQGSFSLDGHDTEPAAHQALRHLADVWPGQSGGPMFGWWSGEPWPRAVGVQSWQTSSRNGASGGGDMVDLIIRARSDFA